MPYISINTWRMNDEESVKKLLEEVTDVVHRHCKAPLDKITVTLTEIEPSRWADAGIQGSDPDFQVKSRRQLMD